MPQTAAQNIPAPAPVPLWERHQLFQEPAWPDGLAPEDEDGQGEE